MVKVTVVGAGRLGLKIAGNLAYCGHDVHVYDSNLEVLEEVYSRLQEDKKTLIEDGLLRTPDFIGKLRCIQYLQEALQSSDFIFEAVPEDLSLKQEIFERISIFCKHDAIIATNSLNFHCDKVAERANHKERCLGLRFLFPVYYIPEVEVTPGTYTSVPALHKVSEFLLSMGKKSFFRYTSEPRILTDEERKKKKTAYLKHVKRMSGCQTECFRTEIPDFVQESLIDNSMTHYSDGRELRKEKDCVVCMDEERNCVLYPCHHLCTCCVCGKILQKQNSSCPICREHITSIFRVFPS